MSDIRAVERDDPDKLKADIRGCGDKVVIIDFFADWCGPCKMIGPKLKKMAEDNFGQVVVFKVNVDESTDIAEDFGIDCMPTFVFFKNGVQVAKFAGANPDKLKTVLMEQLQQK